MKMSTRERAFRERAARHGFEVKRRSKVFTLSERGRVISCSTMAVHEAMFDMHEAARHRTAM